MRGSHFARRVKLSSANRLQSMITAFPRMVGCHSIPIYGRPGRRQMVVQFIFQHFLFE
jgi:hypothetical protein